MANDPTISLIIKAVDLATQDIDGVHERLEKLNDELLKNEFTRGAEGMKNLSDSVKGATQPMADAAKKALALSAAITGISGIMAGKAYNAAVSYESALADLAKVVDGGMESAKQYGERLNTLALQYSQNGQELVQAMTNFKQAGFETEEAFRLVEESVKLMIAGEVDAGEASQQLVSILKGFKEPAGEASRAVDILNAVSNKYATNVKQLAIGMADISPTAKQMGFSMEETAGLLTPVIEVYQSGSEAANALKTGLQKLADDTAPVKAALASIGVSQVDLNGNMRTGKEIFLDVAKSMVGLTDAQKQYVIGQLVGIEQAGRMAQVFDNLAGYLGVTDEALNSTGSAINEVNTRLKTAEAQNQRAAESWRQLGVTLGNTLKPQITGVIGATGDLAKAFDGAVKSGDLAPLLNVLKPQVAAVESLFSAMAANLDGALAGVDWTPLVNGIKELSGEFGEAFAALTDGMDLMTQSGLQAFLQNLINLMGNFTQYVAGVVDGLEPFIDGLNALFQAVSTNLPGFSKLIGQFQGISLAINQGIPFILDWGNKIFGVVGFVIDATGKIGLLVDELKLLSAAGVPVGAILTTLVTKFLALNPAIAGVIAGLAGLPGLVLGLTAAAGGLGVAIGTVANKTIEWVSGGQSLGTMLYDWTHSGEAAALAFSNLTSAQQSATRRMDEANKAWSEGRLSINDLKAAQDAYREAFGGLGEQQVAARENLNRLNKEYQTGKISLDELVEAQKRWLSAFTPANEAQRAALGSLTRINAEYKSGKATLVDLAAAQDAYRKTIEDQVAAHRRQEDAARRAAQATQEQVKADQDSEEWAKKALAAGYERNAVTNQQSLVNERLKASFAGMGLVYDEITGKILHQNEQTAAQQIALRELAANLDKVGVDAGVMGNRTTAAGTEMLAAFNAIVANSQSTSREITAAFLAMIPEAETNAELEAIRVKIEELAKQGKISGAEAAAGLGEIQARAQKVAADPVFDALVEQIRKNAEETEKLNDANLVAAQAELDLAKAKGNHRAISEAAVKALEAELQALRDKRTEQQAELDLYKRTAERISDLTQRKDTLTTAETAELAALTQKYPQIEKIIAARQKEIIALDAKIEVQQRETDAAKRMAGPLGTLTRLYQDQAREIDRERQSIESSVDARIAEQRSIAQVAQAKGDESTAIAALIKQKELEAEKAQAMAASMQKEAALVQKSIDLKMIELAADGALSAADQQQIADLELLAQQKQDAADAAQANADAMSAEAREARDAADVFGEWRENLKLFADTAAGAAAQLKKVNENAKKDAEDTANQVKAAGGLIDSFYNSAITSLSGLSQNAVNEFKRMRGEIVPVTDGIQALTDKTEKLDAAIANVSIKSGLVGFLTKITSDSNQVAKSFLSQAKAAENLTEQLSKVGEKGGAAGGAMEYLIRQAETSTDRFFLLDDVRLNNLQAAVEQANEKLRQMQQETEDAKNRLSELNAELLEAQGADEKAQLLRQQLDYQQSLAEIEKQRAEAELTGNRDLVNTLNEQQRVLEQINRTKIANIQADAASAAVTERTSAAARDLSGNVDTVERLGRAVTSLANADLTRIVGQAGQLRQQFEIMDQVL